MKFGKSQGILLLFLSAAVVASGCVQNNSNNLNPDFDLDHEEIDFNSSGKEVYENTMSKIENVTAYRVEADNKMAMNLPIISLAVNMTSEGIHEPEKSEINNSGTIKLDFGDNSNLTRFDNQIRLTDNKSVNQTEEKMYSREELGISLEALKTMKVENASVLGSTQLNEKENILLNLDVNSSDLMSNSQSIFEVHSPIQDETEETEEMDRMGSFDKVEAYLWIDRETRTASKFAYYGSANNGSLQARSVTEYSER